MEKLIDMGSIEIDGVNTWDAPDFVDAYISAATYTDGTPLDDQALDDLTDSERDMVHQLATESAYGE